MTTAQNDYAPEWLAWIAQNLIRGVSREDVVAHMVNSGIKTAVAERAADEARAHPYVIGGQAAFDEILAIAAKNKEIAEQRTGSSVDPAEKLAAGDAPSAL
ncbi:MAG: hypothetical protein PGN13_00495 [Patulibacter minatonensis]